LRDILHSETCDIEYMGQQLLLLYNLPGNFPKLVHYSFFKQILSDKMCLETLMSMVCELCSTQIPFSVMSCLGTEFAE